MLTETIDTTTQRHVLSATHGNTTIQVVPAAGCNLFSIQFADVELLRQPPSLADLPGFRFGVPVLYPTPGRISDGRFKFDNKTFRFKPDAELGVLHGIANAAAWDFVGAESSQDKTTIHCRLPFTPGCESYDQFPMIHGLELRISLTEGALRWDFVVDNSDGDRAVPFGLGLHPWFACPGRRDSTWLTVPSDRRLVLVDGMATGQSEDISGTTLDARSGVSLASLDIDDVYTNITPEQIVRIDDRGRGLQFNLRASAAFKYLVVYAPAGQPFVCVENWTCPPDAHNLYTRGLQSESNLQIVDAGETWGGWVENEIGCDSRRFVRLLGPKYR